MDLDRDVEDRLREHKEEIRTQQLQVQQQYTKLDTADQNFHVGMAVVTGRLQSINKSISAFIKRDSRVNSSNIKLSYFDFQIVATNSESTISIFK